MGILNQRGHQIRCRIAVEQGVAVNADQQIAPGRRCPGFERQRFPLVFRKINHPQARLLLRQRLQHLRGVVRRAVVDGDNFDIFIPLIQRGADGLPGIPSLVEAGDKNGDERLTGERRGGRLFIPRPVAFKLKPEIEPACYPEHGHEQRPEEHKIQNQLAGKEGGHA